MYSIFGIRLGVIAHIQHQGMMESGRGSVRDE